MSRARKSEPIDIKGCCNVIKNKYIAKSNVQFSKDNEYYTPKEFVAQFGHFDYDPATTKEKAEEFGISNYDTIETNGLNADWSKYKRIWINPPFTDKHKFLAKAWATYQHVHNEIYILFPIEFLTTARFHGAVWGAKSIFLTAESSLRVDWARTVIRQPLGAWL